MLTCSMNIIKTKVLKSKDFLAFKLSDVVHVVFIMLKHVKMATIVAEMVEMSI